ncbi:hypothetical protein KOW79_022559 [Hemibagrus wyckioides]|uniref:Membrane-spanning 4-domains subfamily A member 15-like n=1 Tax=Hemibagrus wyckioides TaxID=337641 RepID=A0A9D3N0J6_9TELE|nr:membrane-spanning 4-domains subfamily A member 4A [Hemibagrus wyckioides]KAG7314063.1 hypothetical protein KOW79_022559 [Hemibagrus wyckioides]
MVSQAPPRPPLTPLSTIPLFPPPLFAVVKHCKIYAPHPQTVEEMDTNAGMEGTQTIDKPSTQTAGGSKPLHRFLRGEPKTVGIVLLFLGLCLFMFGIPLKGDNLETSAESYSPFWLGILYFICGILYIQSERNTTKKIVTISLAFSIIAILGTIVAVIIFIKSLASYSHYMYRFYDNDTDVAVEHYMQLYSMEAVFLFHSLVAGVILISMSVFARLALHSSNTQMFVVMRYPPSAE